MKTSTTLLWIECEESCESWCAVNIYDILAVQEKLELQQHRPKPPFSIFKLLSSQDCPMNCCRQETFQDTCFSSKQANIRSQQPERIKHKKHIFATCFYIATGVRKSLKGWIWYASKWEMYGAGASKPNKGCRSPDFLNEFAFWRQKAETVPFHWLNPTTPHMLDTSSIYLSQKRFRKVE